MKAKEATCGTECHAVPQTYSGPLNANSSRSQWVASFTSRRKRQFDPHLRWTTGSRSSYKSQTNEVRDVFQMLPTAATTFPSSPFPYPQFTSFIKVRELMNLQPKTRVHPWPSDISRLGGVLGATEVRLISFITTGRPALELHSASSDVSTSSLACPRSVCSSSSKDLPGLHLKRRGPKVPHMASVNILQVF